MLCFGPLLELRCIIKKLLFASCSATATLFNLEQHHHRHLCPEPEIYLLPLPEEPAERVLWDAGCRKVVFHTSAQGSDWTTLYQRLLSLLQLEP